MNKIDWVIMGVGLIMLIGFKPLIIILLLFSGIVHLF